MSVVTIDCPDSRWITKAVRVCAPLVMLMANGRMSWADRELYSNAVMETVREAMNMDKESEHHAQDRTACCGDRGARNE
jgi:hypothetical protein